jgi:hypothetical protein
MMMIINISMMKLLNKLIKNSGDVINKIFIENDIY